MKGTENYVYRTSVFDADYKRLVKKFNSLQAEIYQLEQLLIDRPDTGISLGGGVYKIRLACESKGKGKSGGFRVITYLVDERETGTDIYLIMIYDKSEEDSVKISEIKRVITKVLFPGY